jgi:hypothetical protein
MVRGARLFAVADRQNGKAYATCSWPDAGTSVSHLSDRGLPGRGPPDWDDRFEPFPEWGPMAPEIEIDPRISR